MQDICRSSPLTPTLLSICRRAREGRGRFFRYPLTEFLLPLPRLQRLHLAVEDARYRQRLVGRDLARRHRLQRRVEGGDDIAGAGARGEIERDRPAARSRRQTVEEEP